MCLDFSVLMARVHLGVDTSPIPCFVFSLALHHNNLDEDFFVRIITTLVRPSQLRDGHLNPKKRSNKRYWALPKNIFQFQRLWQPNHPWALTL